MTASYAEAFAPASIGNVAVGFDNLGLAIAGAGDSVIARRIEDPTVRLSAITGDRIASDANQLSCVTDENTAGIAASAFWARHGDRGGVDLSLAKGTPLGSGMGSSAASAVAGVVAVNALLDQPLPMGELLEFALTGEAFASKARHADNVAPSLLGGLVLCPADYLPRCVSIPAIKGVYSVLVHPHLRVNTAAARAALSASVPLDAAVRQLGMLARFIDACHRGDAALLAGCVADDLIEHQRSHWVTGFADARDAAMSNGAFGCSLSGSGPSLFALCQQAHATQIAAAMQAAFSSHDVASDYWISPMQSAGAVVRERRS
ncbi:MAG: homoserine kinase [Pseudomonadota bacterium]